MNKAQACIIILSILIPGLLIGAFVVYQQWTYIPKGHIAYNITLEIKYNESTTVTFDNINGSTPFDVLNQCALVVYHYDSGFLLVDTVNGIAEGFWMYYVNSEMGMVSSDLMKLNDSDSVLWEDTVF